MSNDKDTEKDLELDHEYDGIKELNHPLPSWWLITFYGAILFGIGYFFYYNFGPGKTLRAEYKEELEVHTQNKEVYLDKLTQYKPEKFNTYFESEEMVGYGKEIFNNNCQSCHNVQAAGDIGPNLSDNHWLYIDGTPEAFYLFIIGGIPSVGMPAWGPQLSEDELYAITSYVMSIQGIKHSSEIKVKEPQGDEYPFYEHKTNTTAEEEEAE